MDNQTDVSIKFKNSVTGEKKLDEYAKTLFMIKSVLSGIDKGVVEQIEKSADNLKDADTDVKKMSKNFNLAFNYTALRTFARGLSKVVEGFSRMTSRSTAFLEDFNLFQVAFRGNYTEATKFVNKLSEMYGLDEDWLVKTTAQFKQLSNAMGLAEETGEKVSKLMTQLSIDISSLYNVDVDRASSVLQSALAGQTKPVRALGADITQATLQQTLSNLDISQQVSELSYAEKRLLIMISLTQQLSGVTNDWGNTLESPSNQIRIMNEQWQRLQRNVGNIFLKIVGNILPYLNAILMVLNEIAKIIASLFGYKLGDFDFFDESTVGGAEDFGDALDSAADSAEKLKHGLRGFDKLNVISTQSSASGVGGVGGGAGGINPKLMDAFNKAFDDYNKKLEEVQMKATKIRDKIMEWLGFTKQVDEETGEVSFKFDHITAGTVLGALAVGGAIFLGIASIFKIIKKIFDLFKGGNAISKTAETMEKAGTSFTGFFDSVGKGIEAIAVLGGLALVIKALTDMIDTFAKSGLKVTEVLGLMGGVVGSLIALITALTIATQFLQSPLAMVGLLILTASIVAVLLVIEKTLPTILDALGKFITKIGPTLNKILDTIGKNLALIIYALGVSMPPVIYSIGDLFGKVFNGVNTVVSTVGNTIVNIMKTAERLVTTVLQGILNFIIKLGPSINFLVDNIIVAVTKLINFLIRGIEYMINTLIIGAIRGLVTGINNLIPGQKFDLEAPKNIYIPRFKNGIDFVPNDYFGPVYLDYGERVLTKEENQMYSQGNGGNSKPINATFIIQVGNKEIAKQVINDLQDMALNNGKPITIGG